MRQLFGTIFAIVFVLVMTIASGAFAETAGQYIDDATITARVKTALLASQELKALQVRVQTNQGAVQLSGNPVSKNQETEAVNITNQIEGVHSVKTAFSPQ